MPVTFILLCPYIYICIFIYFRNIKEDGTMYKKTSENIKTVKIL